MFVSVPYEITLLSNNYLCGLSCRHVSVPYEITLLSNPSLSIILKQSVSVPYEITLLSNLAARFSPIVPFQYLMKLHYSQTFGTYCTENLLVSVPYEITLLSNV